MVVNELVAKRSKLLADAEALTAGTDFTPEQRSQVDVITAEIGVVDTDIARLNALDEHRSRMRNPVSQPAPDPSQSNDPEERAEVSAAKQKASFRKYLQTGEVESRNLTVSGTGVVIPIGFDPQVIEAKKSYGQILDLVTMQRTNTGEPIRIVFDNDVANGLVPLGAGATEVDPTLTGGSLQTSQFTTGAIGIENALLQDAGFDVDSFIQDKMMKRFYRGASNLAIAGDGGNVASLTAAYNVALPTTTTATGKIGYADLVAVTTSLDPDYQSNAVFAMNNSTLGSILNVLDNNGRPIFLPNYGSGDQRFIGSILGYPVKLVTQLPNVVSGNVPILFGDFKEGYTMRMVNPGLVVLRNPYSLMANNQMAFYGFTRLGGIVTDSGTHPIAALTIK